MKTLVLLALLMPLGASAAKVEEAGDDLLGIRQSNMLKAIESLTIPAKPDVVKDRDTNLVFTVGAAYTEVLIVAKPEKAAKQLAQDFAQCVDGTSLAGGTIEYSSEDDYAVVAESVSSGEFGKLVAENQVPVGDIAERLRAKGWDVGLVVRTPKYVPQDSSGLAFQETTNWNYYASLKPVPGATMRARVAVPVAGRVAFFAFLVMPPVVTLTSLLIAFAYGSIKSIPIDRRRKLYPKMAIWPTFATIGLHMPLALYFLSSRAYRPYADLWLGSGSAMSMSPFIMIPLPFIMVMIPVSALVERKLFGAKAGTPTVPKVEISAVEKNLRKRYNMIGLWTSMAGFAALMGSNFLPRSLSGLKFAALLLFVLLSIAGRFVVDANLKKKLAVFDGPSEDSDLELMARGIANKMGVSFNKLTIDGTLLGRQYPSARVTADSVVTVSARAKEILNEGEIEGLVAHELAHIKLGHVKTRRIFRYLVFGMMLLVFATMLLRLFLQVPLPSMLPILFVIPLVFMLSRSKGARQMEFNADRTAVETLRDPVAYEGMLQKLVSNSAMPGMHEFETGSTHPAMSKRIEAVRQWASQNGFMDGGSQLATEPG